MRTYQWLAAAAVAIAFAAPAHAQSSVTNLGGPNTQPLIYNVIQPSSSNSIAVPQTTFGASKLQGFFHWPTMLSNSRTIGTSTFPNSNTMPPSYLGGFGFSYNGPVVPANSFPWFFPFSH
jgi:hypothetical protein